MQRAQVIDLMEAQAPINDMALKKRLSAIWSDKQRVVNGALMSYGADVTDLFARAAGYVHRILKGATPADLPIEQPTKFVLAIQPQDGDGSRADDAAFAIWRGRIS